MRGRFSKQLLARINQSIDIAQLISKHVQLRKNGNRYLGLCPFHNEKTPSFVVTPNKNMFYCFGCHEHGGPIDFHMKINQSSFPETIHALAKELGITVESNENSDYECFDLLTKLCSENLKKQPVILKQLHNRNVSQDTINTFKLGFMPSIQANALCKLLNCKPETLVSIGIINKDNNTNRFKQRIIYPISDKYGQVIAYGGRSIHSQQQPKYINSPETKHFKKNSVIYNIHQAEKQGYFILVEGYMDVIKLNCHGFNGAVALMGTSFNDERIQNLLNSSRKLYICYDGDDAGKTATNKLSHMCLKYLGPECEIFIIRLPNKHDPDSFIDEHGSKAFKTLIQESKALSGDMIDQLQITHPLNSTISKSRFKQQFLKLSEEIKDSIFKKDFKDLGFKALYSRNDKNPNHPHPKLDKNFISWLDRIIYIIAIEPEICHQLTRDEIDKLIQLQSVQNTNLMFIGHMVNTILKKNLTSIDELINEAKKQQTKDKLENLKQKQTYLAPANRVLELKGAIPKLINEKNKIITKDLINKSKENLLTTEERNQLISLIKKEKNSE
ncbi:MAG: DNA primase [Gammaproteobacteria bacterium]|nr:DNA primase [Gammaproteobacteria bacterium]